MIFWKHLSLYQIKKKLRIDPPKMHLQTTNCIGFFLTTTFKIVESDSFFRRKSRNGMELQTILKYIFRLIIIPPPVPKKRVYTVLVLSVRLKPKFSSHFPSNHASQPLQTWCGVSARILHFAYRIHVRNLSTSCFTT